MSTEASSTKQTASKVLWREIPNYGGAETAELAKKATPTQAVVSQSSLRETAKGVLWDLLFVKARGRHREDDEASELEGQVQQEAIIIEADKRISRDNRFITSKQEQLESLRERNQYSSAEGRNQSHFPRQRYEPGQTLQKREKEFAALVRASENFGVRPTFREQGEMEFSEEVNGRGAPLQFRSFTTVVGEALGKAWDSLERASTREALALLEKIYHEIVGNVEQEEVDQEVKQQLKSIYKEAVASIREGEDSVDTIKGAANRMLAVAREEEVEESDAGDDNFGDEENLSAQSPPLAKQLEGRSAATTRLSPPPAVNQEDEHSILSKGERPHQIDQDDVYSAYNEEEMSDEIGEPSMSLEEIESFLEGDEIATILEALNNQPVEQNQDKTRFAQFEQMLRDKFFQLRAVAMSALPANATPAEAQAFRALQEGERAKFMAILDEGKKSLEASTTDVLKSKLWAANSWTHLSLQELSAAATDEMSAQKGLIPAEKTRDSRMQVMADTVNKAEKFLSRYYALAYPGRVATLSDKKAEAEGLTGIDAEFVTTRDSVETLIEDAEAKVLKLIEDAKAAIQAVPATSLEELKAKREKLAALEKMAYWPAGDMQEATGLGEIWHYFNSSIQVAGEAKTSLLLQNWLEVSKQTVVKLAAEAEVKIKALVSAPLATQKPEFTPADFVTPAPVVIEGEEESEVIRAEAGANRVPTLGSLNDVPRHFVLQVTRASNDFFASEMEVYEPTRSELKKIAALAKEKKISEDEATQIVLADKLREKEVAGIVLATKLAEMEKTTLALIVAADENVSTLGQIVDNYTQELYRLASTKRLVAEAMEATEPKTEEVVVERAAKLTAANFPSASFEEDEDASMVSGDMDGLERAGDFTKYAEVQQPFAKAVIQMGNKAFNQEESTTPARSEALAQNIIQLEQEALGLIKGTEDVKELRKILATFEAKLAFVNEAANRQAQAIEMMEEACTEASRGAEFVIKGLRDANKERVTKGEEALPHMEMGSFSKKLLALEAETLELLTNVGVSLREIAPAAKAKADKATSTEEVEQSEDNMEALMSQIQRASEDVETEEAPEALPTFSSNTKAAIGAIMTTFREKVAELMRSIDKAPVEDNSTLEGFGKLAALPKVPAAIQEALQETTATVYERAYTWLTTFDTSNIGDLILKILAWVTVVFPLVVFTILAPAHNAVWGRQAEVLRGEVIRPTILAKV